MIKKILTSLQFFYQDNDTLITNYYYDITELYKDKVIESDRDRRRSWLKTVLPIAEELNDEDVDDNLSTFETKQAQNESTLHPSDYFYYTEEERRNLANMYLRGELEGEMKQYVDQWKDKYFTISSEIIVVDNNPNWMDELSKFQERSLQENAVYYCDPKKICNSILETLWRSYMIVCLD